MVTTDLSGLDTPRATPRPAAPSPAPPRRRLPAPDPPTAGRRDGFVRALLTLEVLLLPAVLVVPPPHRLLTTSIVLGATLVLAAVPVHGLPATDWGLVWMRWLRRRSVVRRLTATASSSPPGSLPEVGVPVRAFVSGSLVGPRRSEIGVLWSPGGWTGALYVADDGADALARLLALPAAASGAVRLRSVLQQRSQADAPVDPSPSGPPGPSVLPLSAWLVLQVDPVPAIRARDAVGAVPALLRSEMRILFDHTRPGAVGLVALDHADLVDALAASAEQPGGRGASDAHESWSRWRAAGRAHHAFAVESGDVPLPEVVDLLLDGVSLRPGTTVTVSVRHEPGARWPVIARISHPQAEAVADVGQRLRAALAHQQVRTRGLGGRQGLALLGTTLLATTD